MTTSAAMIQHLQDARSYLGFALDGLRRALRDATPLEADTLYAAINETVGVRRRAALIIESRERKEATR